MSSVKKKTTTSSNPSIVQEAKKTFDVSKITFDFKCKNENQKKFLNLINDNLITICAGSAGTGKTYLACAQALKLLRSNDSYTKLVLIKSVVNLPSEEIGHIPGNLNSKLENYIISFLDNFHKLIGEDNTQRMIDNKIIQVLPLAYIRGRSIDNAIIIVDEAQNISINNMRGVLTRIGENSKMIIIGDTKQIDIKERNLSSLEIVVNIFSGKPNIGTMEFTSKDIVRNPIITMIEDEFDAWEAKNKIKK